MENIDSQIWDMFGKYIKAMSLKNNDKTIELVLSNLLKYRKKLKEFSLSSANWITTSEACKRYDISKQSLHQSKLVPNKINKRKMLWNSFDVKCWRDSIDNKLKGGTGYGKR